MPHALPTAYSRLAIRYSLFAIPPISTFPNSKNLISTPNNHETLETLQPATPQRRFYPSLTCRPPSLTRAPRAANREPRLLRRWPPGVVDFDDIHAFVALLSGN
jgi:hypothetical protein